MASAPDRVLELCEAAREFLNVCTPSAESRREEDAERRLEAAILDVEGYEDDSIGSAP